jgi:hypothetical protein
MAKKKKSGPSNKRRPRKPSSKASRQTHGKRRRRSPKHERWKMVRSIINVLVLVFHTFWHQSQKRD